MLSYETNDEKVNEIKTKTRKWWDKNESDFETIFSLLSETSQLLAN